MIVAAGDVDWLARGLGAGGLLLSAIGTAIGVLAYRRDRPDLRLRWRADPSIPELEVTTTNAGQQPVALASIWIADWRPPWWVRRWRFVRPFRWLIGRIRGDFDYGELVIDPFEAPTTPAVLRPGEPYVARFEAQRIVRLAEARPKLWIIALDTLGNELVLRVPSRAIEILRVSVRGR